ncbi:GNAT family N-acetyltransferase [Chondromyces apiculatus]|uniref:N-acetyltransferase domain-containing protein n=1 Tax=Chondromyces apiculatus DSM 436 TaxID=1192034 RepID=A0A017SZL1_9BACT|nr:GNAT family N-acetyltransferase [Chondromyces apiculatus]EYF02197.1 Hypothetical protein CAP_7408 [Chondromyces apiculatus DSM 436]
MQKTYAAERIEPGEHLATLGRLWRDNLAEGEVTEELVARRMRWFHEENPAGAARTWIGLHGAERDVIGCASFYPRVTQVAGQRLLAGILGDFAVDKAHRIAGAAMAIQRAIAQGAREAGAEILYAFPNRASFPIFQRCGYAKVTDAVMWVKPLTAAYKLQELASAAPEVRRETAHTVVGRVADQARRAIPAERWRALWEGALPEWIEDRLVDAIGAPEHPIVRTGVRAADTALAGKDAALLLAQGRRVDGEITKSADARFDDLWSRAKPTYIMGERTAAYLNWRYATFKTTDYRFFCVTDRRDGQLVGYAIYYIQGNKVVIADLFCEDFDAHAGLVLLKLAERMRREGYDAIGLAYVGPTSFGERLRTLGFFQRAFPKDVGSRWLIVRVDAQTPEALRAELLNPERWWMTEGELDA